MLRDANDMPDRWLYTQEAGLVRELLQSAESSEANTDLTLFRNCDRAFATGHQKNAISGRLSRNLLSCCATTIQWLNEIQNRLVKFVVRDGKYSNRSAIRLLVDGIDN